MTATKSDQAVALYTVAIYPPGDSYNRVLVPDLQASEADVPRAARDIAQRAISALALLPPEQWLTTVVAVAELSSISHRISRP